ncbi:hypothetical protein I3843_11G076500 [Carya illinoinensis]|nr:hypothetical protein I3843_11G076500 [Carya illinoinensis]
MQHHMDSTHTSSHMQKSDTHSHMQYTCRKKLTRKALIRTHTCTHAGAHHTCRKRDSNSHMQTSKAFIRTTPTWTLQTQSSRRRNGRSTLQYTHTRWMLLESKSISDLRQEDSRSYSLCRFYNRTWMYTLGRAAAAENQY